jgi:serine/threonine protein kinase
MAELTHPNVVRYYTTWLEFTNDLRKYSISEDIIEELSDSPPSSPKDKLIIFDKFLIDEKKTYPILFLQMELCDMSLKKYIIERNYKCQFNLTKTKKLFKQIVEGVQYINKNNIIHRDITTYNIFLKDDVPKIGDFGLAIHSKVADNNPIKSSNYSTIYSPPEYIKNNIYTLKSEIYSLGIIYFELLNIFITEMERVNEIQNAKKGKISDEFKSKFPEECKLIQKMIDENILVRPPIEKILAELI